MKSLVVVYRKPSMDKKGISEKSNIGKAKLNN